MLKTSHRWFCRGYAELVLYLSDHPGLGIPSDYRAPDGFLLGEFVEEVRFLWKDNMLSPDEVQKLKQIGLSPDEKDQGWYSMYRIAKLYYQEKGELPKDVSMKTYDGVFIGAWLDRQKRLYEQQSEEKKQLLNEIGIT